MDGLPKKMAVVDGWSLVEVRLYLPQRRPFHSNSLQALLLHIIKSNKLNQSYNCQLV